MGLVSCTFVELTKEIGVSEIDLGRCPACGDALEIATTRDCNILTMTVSCVSNDDHSLSCGFEVFDTEVYTDCSDRLMNGKVDLLIAGWLEFKEKKPNNYASSFFDLKWDW